jgi:hypothetical protein
MPISAARLLLSIKSSRQLTPSHAKSFVANSSQTPPTQVSSTTTPRLARTSSAPQKWREAAISDKLASTHRTKDQGISGIILPIFARDHTGINKKMSLGSNNNF